MELAFMCLSWIELAFLCAYFFTSIFFRLERAVVHQTITTTVLTLSYGTEAVLRIITSNVTFILSILLVLIWGFNLFASIRRLRRVNQLKKEIEEERKRTEKEQP